MNRLETHIGEDCPVAVHYDFEEGQKEIVHAPPEDCQPGFPAKVTINEVFVDEVATGEVSIISVLSKNCTTRLEEECLEHYGGE